MMSEALQGLIFAFLLDENGGGRPLDWDEIRRWSPEGGILWLHLNRWKPESEAWIRNESGLDPLVADVLLEEETRPRCAVMKGGLLLILRSVNSKEDSGPEDMISIRMWIEPQRIITLRSMRLDFVSTIRDWIEEGGGPKDLGELVLFLLHGLNEQMAPVLSHLSEQMDTMEDELIDPDMDDPREGLTELRRRIVFFHRYIVPQREAVGCLLVERVSWLNDLHRHSLSEALESIKRFVEDLTMLRERVVLIQDEIASRMDERMNRNVYWLSLMAAIFLPLSFLTGLLGINVRGIPGADEPLAFAIVCGIMVLLAAVQIWLLKKWKIF